MKQNHILAKVALACCVLAAFILGASQLPKMSDVKMFTSAQIQEKLIPYQQDTAVQREKLEQQRLIAERWEEYARAMKAKKDIEFLPTKQRNNELRMWILTGALAWLIFGVSIGFFVLMWRKHEHIAAVMIALRRPAPVDITKEWMRLQREELRYLQTCIHEITPEDRRQALDVPYSQHEAMPDAKTCLDRGLMSGGNPSFFFGINLQGEHEYEDVHEKHLGIIGEGRIGKSNTLINIAAQGSLKGYLILAIDLHYPNKQSFTEKFGELAKAPNFRGYHRPQDALEAIYFLDTQLNKRLSGESESEPHIFVICDELKNLMRQFKRNEELFFHVASVFERLTEEGGKTNISFLVASHTWLAKDLGTTAWKDQLNYRIGLRSAPRQAQTFGFEKEWKGKFKHLEPGQIIYEDAGGYYHECQVPLWTPDAIRKAASMIPEVSWPDLEDPTREDLNEYAQDVIRLDDYRSLSTEEILKRLSAMQLTQKEIARRSGLNEHTIGRILSRESEMRGGTKRKLIEVIA